MKRSENGVQKVNAAMNCQSHWLLWAAACVWMSDISFVQSACLWESAAIHLLTSSSGAVWKSRWTSWAPVPNKPIFCGRKATLNLLTENSYWNDLVKFACWLHQPFAIWWQHFNNPWKLSSTHVQCDIGKTDSNCDYTLGVHVMHVRLTRQWKRTQPQRSRHSLSD